MFREFQLPDGSFATSAADVDRYLKESGSALADDYSGEFLKNRRFLIEKAQEESFLSDFVRNYKKQIWTS
jgi:hypothetical protein